MKCHRLKRPAARRGIFMVDAVVGITIAVALLISFSIAVGSLHKGERKLADERAAARRLEDNLIALQTGGKADPALPLERLPGSVAGKAWVRISTPAGQMPHTSLVGLIPADQAPGGTP